MNPLLFLFLDGVGVSKTSENNPLAPLFKSLTGVELLEKNLPIINDDLLIKSIDPILGVKGIPQSATGQTSIMTGKNSQKFIGYHQTAFPNKELMEILKEYGLLKELKEDGLKVTCINLYSREYFERRSKRRKNMFPVSALSVMYADLPFRFIENYNRGEAVFADITSRRFGEIKPEEAAERVINISKNYNFLFFEYFLTDTYGHKKNVSALEKECKKLNRFIETLWSSGRNNLDIVICSDHGNAECSHIANHTSNPVPFLFLTKNNPLKEYLLDNVEDITHIKNAINTYFFNSSLR